MANNNLERVLTIPNGRVYKQPLGLFINNEFVPSSNGKTISSTDPATESLIAEVQAASVEDVDKAVRAARTAFHQPTWKSLSPTDRGILLSRFANLVEENKELLAAVEAWDNGKPYAVALNEDVSEVVTTLRYYSGWADKVFGQTISTTVGKFAYTLRQPIGVVAQVIPWNYPLAMAAWKLGPALACGNTVVMKAAEQTPLSILLLGNLIKKAGFPPGVVNFINGYGSEAGTALVEHPFVDKVAFTGSTATGKAIMASAAKSLKNITLETGGKSPLILFKDADLDEAVSWSHGGIMSNQGQICTATSRILVHRSIMDEFITRFCKTVSQVSVVGNQWDPNTFQGPQVSRAQLDKILAYAKIGQNEGAKLEMGGQACPINGKGYFVQPTVFSNVREHMRIWHEEVFGPFVTLASFETEEEAIALANNSVYGLGAAVFTRDVERAHRVASEIEAGMVWINSSQDSDPRVPFGGVKQSGIGRELGEAGLDAYTQIKSVHLNMQSKL